LIKYILQKLWYSLFVIWGVVSLVFVLFNVLPADPARLIMGQRTDAKALENTRKNLRLDQPIIHRYVYYLNDIAPISINNINDIKALNVRYSTLVELNNQKALILKTPYLGRSYRSQKLVTTIIQESLPGTISLAISAMVIATILGITLGTISATFKDTWVDISSITASVIGISMPSFFVGLIVAYVFGYLFHDITGLSITGSLMEYNPITGESQLSLKNIILPAIALGIRPTAIIAQLTRSSLLDVIHQDYIRTAYAKGLSTFQVLVKHAIPNALNPIITAISGWMAELLAGSFFVEFIFGWKGLGKITVDALDKFDFPIVMGAVLVSALIFVFVNLIADLILAKNDPRIRL
jgi:peptide/nickel transport system permease protein